MPRRLPLPAFLLVLALGGCTSQRAAVPGYAWAFMNDPGEGPKLAYGRPSSDEVLLMMTCGGGPGRVALTAAGLTGSELAVSSGGQVSRLAATPTSGLGEDDLLRAVTDHDAQALRNFRGTGDLAILHGGKRHGIAAAPTDRSQVRAFFAACEV